MRGPLCVRFDLKYHGEEEIDFASSWSASQNFDRVSEEVVAAEGGRGLTSAENMTGEKAEDKVFLLIAVRGLELEAFQVPRPFLGETS